MTRERESEPGRRAPWPIEAYGAIGDARSLALVAPDGGIDFCCLPRFDDPALFCRLLDLERGGTFRAGPAQKFRYRRAWLDDSNVLVTEYATDGGRLRMTEFMPIRGEGERPRICRKLEGLEGAVPVEILCRPSFDFARQSHEVSVASREATFRSPAGNLRVTLPFRPSVAGDAVRAEGVVGAGDTHWVCLAHAEGALPDGTSDEEAARLLDATRRTWSRWCARGHYGDERPELLRRSALVLALLTDSDTGAPVAAGTTSLPEDPGGVRNWDYRYTWLRDAVWSLDALMRLDYHDEAMAFWDWLAGHIRGKAQDLRIAYRSGGGDVPAERSLDHLAGYADSRPVRVGNAARNQRQLDVYGTIIDGIHRCSEGMPAMRPLEGRLAETVLILAERIVQDWKVPGRGMWEQRNRDEQFTASKIWCWAGLDRALALAERDRLDVPLRRWKRAREEIRQAVLSRGFSKSRGTFVRTLGGDDLDASVLFAALTGMLPADDERVTSTVAVLQRDLTDDGFLRRYDSEDGCEGREGAFLLVNFWLVSVLARAGRKDEARELLGRLEELASPVGLFAEEVDVATGGFLGNYPQAFTHLGLVQAILDLEGR